MKNSIEKWKVEEWESNYEAALYSLIGHRDYQQDYAGLVVEKNKMLAVICDGMGGLQGGERASREAVTVLVKDYEREAPAEEYTEFLCRKAFHMDQIIFGLRDENGALLKAGTTVVSVILENGMLHWMSVGDSRIYLLRGDSMVAVTRDHNYRRELTEALERGDITPEFFEKEASGRRAEALTNYLGMGGIKRIERNYQPFALQDGDCILLCSDGLYKRLDEHQIRALLIDNRISSKVAAKRLTQMTMQLASRGQDNTTVIVIQYHTGQEEV